MAFGVEMWEREVLLEGWLRGLKGLEEGVEHFASLEALLTLSNGLVYEGWILSFLIKVIRPKLRKSSYKGKRHNIFKLFKKALRVWILC